MTKSDLPISVKRLLLRLNILSWQEMKRLEALESILASRYLVTLHQLRRRTARRRIKCREVQRSHLEQEQPLQGLDTEMLYENSSEDKCH